LAARKRAGNDQWTPEWFQLEEYMRTLSMESNKITIGLLFSKFQFKRNESAFPKEMGRYTGPNWYANGQRIHSNRDGRALATKFYSFVRLRRERVSPIQKRREFLCTLNRQYIAAGGCEFLFRRDGRSFANPPKYADLLNNIGFLFRREERSFATVALTI